MEFHRRFRTQASLSRFPGQSRLAVLRAETCRGLSEQRCGSAGAQADLIQFLKQSKVLRLCHADRSGSGPLPAKRHGGATAGGTRSKHRPQRRTAATTAGSANPRPAAECGKLRFGKKQRMNKKHELLSLSRKRISLYSIYLLNPQATRYPWPRSTGHQNTYLPLDIITGEFLSAGSRQSAFNPRQRRNSTCSSQQEFPRAGERVCRHHHHPSIAGAPSPHPFPPPVITQGNTTPSATKESVQGTTLSLM